MSAVRRTVIAGLVTGWLVISTATLVRAGDQPRAQDTERKPDTSASMEGLPDDLRDPAFDKYVDMAALPAALEAHDAVRLTDAGLQLAEGERVLLRPCRTIKADQVLALASRIAAGKKDIQTLTRLSKAAKALGRKDLETIVDAAQKLAGTSRGAGLMVNLDQISPETFAGYRGFRERIGSAIALQDKQALKDVFQEVQESTELDGKLRSHLGEWIKEAAMNLPETGADIDLFKKLTDTSRGVMIRLPSLVVNTSAPPHTQIQQMNQAVSAQMARVASLAQQQQNLRNEIASLSRIKPATLAERLRTRARLAALSNQLDSLSEMGEMESLRLQMAMDRLSKMMQTLSNIMKKMNDTSKSIVANIK